METRLICISGFRLSGKSELCRRVREKASDYGLVVEILSFAAPLKEMFCKAKGIGIEMLTAPTLKEDFRQEMEEFSIKCKKENGEDFFTNLLIDKISNPYMYYAVDDIRLLDEVEAVLKKKAAIYRIVSDLVFRKMRGLKTNSLSDNSRFEQELNLPQEIFKSWGGEYIFNNTASISELNLEADLLVRRHYLKNLNKMF